MSQNAGGTSGGSGSSGGSSGGLDSLVGNIGRTLVPSVLTSIVPALAVAVSIGLALLTIDRLWVWSRYAMHGVSQRRMNARIDVLREEEEAFDAGYEEDQVLLRYQQLADEEAIHENYQGDRDAPLGSWAAAVVDGRDPDELGGDGFEPESDRHDDGDPAEVRANPLGAWADSMVRGSSVERDDDRDGGDL